MWFYEKWLARANAGVLVSVLGLLLTVALAYPLAARLPIAVQILAHM